MSTTLKARMHKATTFLLFILVIALLCITASDAGWGKPGRKLEREVKKIGKKVEDYITHPENILKDAINLPKDIAREVGKGNASTHPF
jgi:hypothetical protein